MSDLHRALSLLDRFEVDGLTAPVEAERRSGRVRLESNRHTQMWPRMRVYRLGQSQRFYGIRSDCQADCEVV
jgi:hypothetical protein